MAWVESEPHLAATSVKRFFFWIQLSRLARVYTRVYNKRERSALEALLTLERGRGGEGARGLFFFLPSIDRSRATDSIRSSFFSSFFPPPLLPFSPSSSFFISPPLSLSLLSYLPPAHNSNALCRRNNGTKVLPGSRVGQDLSRNSCREFCCNFYSIRRRKFVETPRIWPPSSIWQLVPILLARRKRSSCTFCNFSCLQFRKKKKKKTT